MQKKFTEDPAARVTPDIAVDQERDGEGDIKIQLKYRTLKYTAQSFWWFTQPFLEICVLNPLESPACRSVSLPPPAMTER